MHPNPIPSYMNDKVLPLGILDPVPVGLDRSDDTISFTPFASFTFLLHCEEHAFLTRDRLLMTACLMSALDPGDSVAAGQRGRGQRALLHRLCAVQGVPRGHEPAGPESRPPAPCPPATARPRPCAMTRFHRYP